MGVSKSVLANTVLLVTLPSAANVTLCKAPSPKLPTNRFPRLSKASPSAPYWQSRLVVTKLTSRCLSSSVLLTATFSSSSRKR